MVKIKTTEASRLGATLNIYGKVTTIPKDGIIEVDEKIATRLVENGAGWEYADKKEDAPTIKERLQEMSLEQLTALAEKKEIPESDYKKFSKNVKTFSTYLASRVSESDLLPE